MQVIIHQVSAIVLKDVPENATSKEIDELVITTVNSGVVSGKAVPIFTNYISKKTDWETIWPEVQPEIPEISVVANSMLSK